MSEIGNCLCIVLAADAHDYVDWCRATQRTPFDGTAWAISRDTGLALGGRRTFQVTDRWRENQHNRHLVRQFSDGDGLDGVIPYGDEDGPWPAERTPDLSWPSWWQRFTTRHRQAA
ncbi:hypothetical protein OHV08_34125 [Streptomyces canus]|uniref:hypothetical protein n=1 Tax=Streptomyces canus TaxID=58343 RepID=UPI003246F2A9